MSPPAKRERPGRRRTAMSCDRCKNRKTKCIDPVPGPCQFCASIGAECHLDPSRRRQRPYYRVSEEEFRCMTRLLEHFVPNTEFNLTTLRALASNLDGTKAEEGLSPAGNGLLGLSPASSSLVSPGKIQEEDMEAGEIDELHRQMGWLRLDSNGIYRHVGPNSTYSFLDAVRSLTTHRPTPSPSPEVLPPLSAAHPLPPAAPDSAARQKSLRQISLPRRDLCDACVSRFFRDIQSVYWFFSAERLHAALDRIYAGDAGAATPALLCGLYSIFAITSESQVERDGTTDEVDQAGRPGRKYLALAKSLVPALCDDGDTDSVRALCLLSLALSSSMFGNTAYVYLGTAARIAFTLGLHSHGVGSRHGLHGQEDLRLFGTLYLLDLDVALCYGHPPAIGEDVVLKAPSEDILSPGSSMPLDYLEVACKLSQLKRRLSRLIYQSSTSNGARINLSAVSSALASLSEWYAELPPHMCDYRQVASFHHRSVAILHLQYWRAVSFATRPFLLYSVSQGRKTDDAKQRSFDEFGTMCLDAARNSVEIISFLHDRDLLSSLVPLDCTCILECMQVFVLALADTNSSEHLEAIRTCLRALQGMEQILWPKHALTEVMAQLEEHGIWDGGDVLVPAGMGTSGLMFLDVVPSNEFVPESGILFDSFTQETGINFMPSPDFQGL